MRKTLKTLGKPGRQCQCLFQWPVTSCCNQQSGPSRLAGTDPSNSDTATAVCGGGVVCTRSRGCLRTRVRACVRPFGCACVRPRVRASVRAYVCASVRTYVRACVGDVFAIYDNNI